MKFPLAAYIPNVTAKTGAQVQTLRPLPAIGSTHERMQEDLFCLQSRDTNTKVKHLQPCKYFKTFTTLHRLRTVTGHCFTGIKRCMELYLSGHGPTAVCYAPTAQGWKSPPLHCVLNQKPSSKSTVNSSASQWCLTLTFPLVPYSDFFALSNCDLALPGSMD